MNKKELKLLHNKIIEIAEYFDTFCNENNIRKIGKLKEGLCFPIVKRP